MVVTSSYRTFVLDQLGRIVEVRSRAMFGGVGIYGRLPDGDEVFFALIDDDRTYLKVDEETRPEFEAAGSGPFMPGGDPERVMNGYWQLPAGAIEDVAELERWVGKGLAAAERARRP